MKKIIYLSIVIFVLSFVVKAQPILVIEGGDVYNFGNKDRATENPVTTSIKIFNAGNQTLTVENPRSTCGCLSTPLDKNTIEPGEFATLNVKLYLNVSHGNYQKSVEIISNDPNTPKRTLSLTAFIAPKDTLKNPINYSPLYFDFGLMEKNKEAKAEIELVNTSSEDIKIEDITIPNGIDLNIKKGKKIPANGKISLTGEFEPKNKGLFSGVMLLKTSNTNLGTINIPVWGYTR